MIFNEPENWKQLQEYVNIIFTNIGYESYVEKKIKTPRGNIDIDVYALDNSSINKDKYVVECKWWNNKVPQTVIHAFTTVMAEIGGNFGYVITKIGFQSGAKKYLNFTNIKAITFLEFQQLYFKIWYNNFFRPYLISFSNNLIDYIEPINSRRFKYFDELSENQKVKYFDLFDKYEEFGYYILKLRTTENYSEFDNIENIKNQIKETGINTKSNCANELLEELNQICQNIIIEFNNIFGKNIFQE